MRSAREALTASRRAPLLSALGIVTIAFSLFVLGLFGLVVVNLQDALRGVEERVGRLRIRRRIQRIEMRGLLKELRNMGKTILVSSHILPEDS